MDGGTGHAREAGKAGAPRKREARFQGTGTTSFQGPRNPCRCRCVHLEKDAGNRQVMGIRANDAALGAEGL